jgi:S-adenosyl-L-methionine hydrolase (adenosine-forming)
MTPPVITLTTDFGRTAPYVAVMKGVILSINPAAHIIDLSHEIRPQDVRHAAYFLGTAAPYFPPGTIHVCVVDPGVGSERAALCLDVKGQHFVGPDNGVFTKFIRCGAGAAAVRKLTEARFWRVPNPSDTFHGRDIFAPVAAHLSCGVSAHELGPIHPEPVMLPTRAAVTFGKQWSGEVQFIDDFGNIITNVPTCKLKSLPVKVALGGTALGAVRWVRTYSEAAPGELVCLFSSDGYFELAEVNGHAARRLGAHPGAAIELEWD